MINKSYVRRKLKEYSNRTSISPDAVERIDDICKYLLFVIIQEDNQGLQEQQTLTEQNVDKAVRLLSVNTELDDLLPE